MRILVVAPRYHINLHDRIKSLQRVGHVVSLLVQYRGISEKHEALDPKVMGYSGVYRVLEWLCRRSRNQQFASNFRILVGFPPVRRFFLAIRTSQPDLVVMKGLRSLLALATLVSTRLLGINTVVLIQRSRFGNRTLGERLVCFLVFRVLGVRAVISPVSKKTVDDPGNHPRFWYIPFVYDVKDFERKYFLEDRVNLLNVAKFVRSKGQLTLLRAVGRLKDKYRLRLTMIGARIDDEYVDVLRGYARAHGLDSIVKLEFDLPHDAVIRAYRESDLFLLASDREPASLQVLEAMANKVAVISSDTNGTGCYVSEAKSGFLFESGNDADLADKIDRVIGHRETVVSMGRQGFEIAKASHASERFGHELLRAAEQ